MFINSSGKCYCLSFIVFIVYISWVSCLYATNQKTIESLVAEKAETKRQNPGVAINIGDIIGSYDGDSVLPQAINLTRDPNNPAIREFGYKLISAIVSGYDNLQLQRTSVNALVDGLTDNEKNLSAFCLGRLKTYPKEYFSGEAKDKLKQCLDELLSKKRQGRRVRDIILLAGVADAQSVISQLQTIVDQVDEPLHPFKITDPQSHMTAFSALKAMARMGDEEAAKRCISLVDSEKDEDFKVRILLQNISYIRQPEAVDYIKQYLYSDNKTCFAGSDVIGRSYSQVAAGYLKEIIVGFPNEKEIFDFYLKTRGTDLNFRKKWPSSDDYYIHRCRQWFESQTSIEIVR